MTPNIKISNDLLNTLNRMKIYDEDTYEDIIWDLAESRMELSEEAKKNIAKAEQEIKAGKVHKLEDIKKQLKI